MLAHAQPHGQPSVIVPPVCPDATRAVGGDARATGATTRSSPVETDEEEKATLPGCTEPPRKDGRYVDHDASEEVAASEDVRCSRVSADESGAAGGGDAPTDDAAPMTASA